MKNHTAAAPKKSRLTTNLIIAVFMLSIIGLAAWNLPRGYSVDLTLIGKGKNIVVQVHDHNLVDSTHLMGNLSAVRGEYNGTIEFVVADLNLAAGQAFAKAHKVDPATLLFFSPDGDYLGNVQGVQAPGDLRNILNKAFNLSKFSATTNYQEESYG